MNAYELFRVIFGINFSETITMNCEEIVQFGQLSGFRWNSLTIKAGMDRFDLLY